MPRSDNSGHRNTLQRCRGGGKMPSKHWKLRSRNINGALVENKGDMNRVYMSIIQFALANDPGRWPACTRRTRLQSETQPHCMMQS